MFSSFVGRDTAGFVFDIVERPMPFCTGGGNDVYQENVLFERTTTTSSKKKNYYYCYYSLVDVL